jgi:hypothetical protein
MSAQARNALDGIALENLHYVALKLDPFARKLNMWQAGLPCVLIAIAEESERTSELNKPDVFGILEILRLIGDEYHQGKEEKALFSRVHQGV